MTRLVAVTTNLSELKLTKNLHFLLPQVDLLELRIDLFTPTERKHLVNILKNANKKISARTICTIRSKAEGGGFSDIESKRFELFRTFIPHCGYVDIELNSKILSSVVSFAKEKSKKIIISYHNFQKTPTNNVLYEIFSSAMSSGADIIKIATHVKNFYELSRVMQFYVHYSKLHKLAFIPMTEKISSARILLMSLGSTLAYGYLGKSVAPGQVSINYLTKLKRII